MKDLVETLVKSIVSNPQDVEVIADDEEQDTKKIVIKVNKEDMGVIIGKEGKTIKAIRTLANIKAMKNGERVWIEVNEPLD